MSKREGFVMADVEEAFRRAQLKQGVDDLEFEIIELRPAFAFDDPGKPTPSPSGFMSKIHGALEEAGVSGWQIQKLTLRMMSTRLCPLGTVPKLVCETLADGTIRCETKCVTP
jgi:hypothetical protein